MEHGWTHEHIRISIHAPLAGRDLGCNSWTEYRDISIHAPLAGRDARSREWEAANRISIHAPLAGRDAAKAAGIYGTRNFNPRAPCGARLPPLAAPPCYTGFQSTRPLRGATFPPIAAQVASGISIHAPLAGRDIALPFTIVFYMGISIHAPLAGRDLRSDSAHHGDR